MIGMYIHGALQSPETVSLPSLLPRQECFRKYWSWPTPSKPSNTDAMPLLPRPIPTQPLPRVSGYILYNVFVHKALLLTPRALGQQKRLFHFSIITKHRILEQLRDVCTPRIHILSPKTGNPVEKDVEKRNGNYNDPSVCNR